MHFWEIEAKYFPGEGLRLWETDQQEEMCHLYSITFPFTHTIWQTQISYKPYTHTYIPQTYAFHMKVFIYPLQTHVTPTYTCTHTVHKHMYFIWIHTYILYINTYAHRNIHTAKPSWRMQNNGSQEERKRRVSPKVTVTLLSVTEPLFNEPVANLLCT